ncbi:MAG: cupin domain-containing protein [Caulobacteraceae bacterium]|nr:cupin domain-containing protein [Caulobacteraceae bacterium]
MKRAVFGIDSGVSKVLIDAEAPERERSGSVGMISREVWSTSGATPTTETRDSTLDQPINAMVHPGETRFRVVTFPAGHQSAMHRTRTIDYGVILSGSVDLAMEDGSVTRLDKGDCLVQLGGVHAWRVPADEPVTIAFVMVGAQKAG